MFLIHAIIFTSKLLFIISGHKQSRTAIQTAHPRLLPMPFTFNLPFTGASTSCQRGGGTQTGTSCRSEAQKNTHHGKKMSCFFTCRLQEMQILIHFSLNQMMTQTTAPVALFRVNSAGYHICHRATALTYLSILGVIQHSIYTRCVSTALSWAPCS